MPLQEEYLKKHEFKEEELSPLSFYTVAKYGLEKIGVIPEKLFEKEEAVLALKHAEKCRSAAEQLKSYMELHGKE